MSAGSVAVVGGGPAGLIAAEYLAAAGKTVTVYESRRSVGRKFLLAGRSGLNLTNEEPLEALIERYSPAGALAAALRAFTPGDLRHWAEGLGQNTFAGSSGRVFPESMRATPLLRSWLVRLADQGVEIRTDHRWTGWEPDGSLRFGTAEGEQIVQVEQQLPPPSLRFNAPTGSVMSDQTHAGELGQSAETALTRANPSFNDRRRIRVRGTME